MIVCAAYPSWWLTSAATEVSCANVVTDFVRGGNLEAGAGWGEWALRDDGPTAVDRHQPLTPRGPRQRLKLGHNRGDVLVVLG